MGDHLRAPVCVDFSLGNGQPAPQLDDASPGDEICGLRSPEEIDRHARGDGLQGDISQLALDNPDLRFVIPEEGGMRWSDTMVIPNGAENVAAAAEWMNYVYDPVNAVRITAYVGYNTPVAGVRELLADSDDEFERALAESPLIFPDDATLAQLHVFKNLDEEEEAAFDERFSTIVGA